METTNLCEVKMNMYLYPVFPTLLLEVICEDYSKMCDSLVEWIYEYKSQTSSVVISNRGGWQSPNNPDIPQVYKDYILSHALYALNELYDVNFELDNLWINVNGKGNYNTTHCHPISIVSGVFWVKTSENCGELKFFNPHQYSQGHLLQTIRKDIQKQSDYFNVYEFQPQSGRMILFPSDLYHNVEENESDEERISIAFNLKVVT